MKKILFASTTIFICGLISCADRTTKKDDATVNIKENNINFYKALENGNEATIKKWITTDAVDHNGGANGEDLVGGDKITAMLTQMHNSFEPGMKMNIVSQAIDGDYLYTLVEMKGTTTANPGMGFSSSTKIDSRSVDVVKLKDGKAQEHWGFMGMPDVMMMMKNKSSMPLQDKMDMPDGAKMPMKDSAK